MPQLLLPIFPDAVTPIKDLLSVGKQDGRVVYFHGVLPVFSHGEEDLATFRMITAQFIAQGHLRVELLAALVEIGELQVLRHLDAARVRRRFADQQLDQRALAGAVRADDADAIAAQNQRREIVE